MSNMLIMSSAYFEMFVNHNIIIGTSDYEHIIPIRVFQDSTRDSTSIRLITHQDIMSLEYDDSIILVFTPDDPELIPALEDFGEFIRDTATVNIIDDDSKYYRDCIGHRVYVPTCT